MPTRAIEIRRCKAMSIFVRLNDGRTGLDGRIDVSRLLATLRRSFDRICRQAEGQQ
jgi:hypothetical protein